MSETNQTQVSALKKKTTPLFQEIGTSQQPVIDWQSVPDAPRGQALLKNLGVAAALVLCAVTLRTGAIPSLSDATDAVLTAATDQSLLDDQLGKLSFVSALFPETVLVFGESSTPELSLPVSGGVVIHAWSEGEPYLTMRTQSRDVVSASDGEVSGIFHGNGEERLIQVTLQDGTTCIYGNMDSIAVSTGDYVNAGMKLGCLLPGEDLAFEVRKNGISVDPRRYLLR